jgi:hypothetical protein
MAEGGYEGVEFGKRQTPHDIRKQAYWTHLAGGFHVYGHNDNWQAPHRWHEWIDAPGARHLRVFRDAMTSVPHWWQLVPDPSLLVADAGGGYSRNMAAHSAAGEWVLTYLSEPSTVTLRLDSLTAGASFRANWIDTTTGTRTPAGTFTTTDPVSFTSPPGWEEDAVLLVEAE